MVSVASSVSHDLLMSPPTDVQQFVSSHLPSATLVEYFACKLRQDTTFIL